MQLFYEPNANSSEFILNKEEATHCIKVLRKKTGDYINVVDGKGLFYHCEILQDSPKKCLLKPKEITEDKNSSKAIHIAIAPTKSIDRTEWFVEKAVEIGVSEISFIACQNSERRVIKLDRIEKKAISAMKQSLKATLPRINPLIKFTEFIAATNADQKFIAFVDFENPKELKDHANQDSSIMLIGPEGDFTREELALAVNYNYTKVSLGSSRLRTETAGIVACTLLNN